MRRNAPIASIVPHESRNTFKILKRPGMQERNETQYMEKARVSQMETEKLAILCLREALLSLPWG